MSVSPAVRASSFRKVSMYPDWYLAFGTFVIVFAFVAGLVAWRHR